MRPSMFSAITGLVMLTACSSTPSVESVLADARRAMGNPTSIQYSGKGVNGNFGQALTAGQEWPRRNLIAYARMINYQQRSSAEKIEFAEEVFGGQLQNPMVNGNTAWNMQPAGPQPVAPAAAEERQLMIWLTPHGFLRAAAEATGATVTAGENGNTISFTVLGKYPVSGTVDRKGLVARVETKIANPVLGDTPVIATYSDYAGFSGIEFPTHILVEQGGFPVWDLTIDKVDPENEVSVPVPANLAPPAAGPVTVTSTRLAPGVWHLTGGSHHSVVVDQGPHIAVVEGPLSDARAVAVIAEAKKLVPNKPVQYVIVTHHHFDHAGGLRAFVAEGATIVTHESNKAYFEQAFQNPATIAPDTLERNKKPPVIQTLTDKATIGEGANRIEVHQIDGDTHTTELLVAYLPGSRILVEADAYSPQQDPNARPAMPPPNAVNLYEKIMAKNLAVNTIAPIHGRGAVPFGEFRRFVGK
jgi:glyoxylase-like metal-dependent hydrolase (beta-lactamase superfamily II)